MDGRVWWRAAQVLCLAPLVLAGTACSHGNGSTTLSWYINPDNGGQAQIAKRCTDAAGGRYRIETNLLPRDASDQREQLLRRLAAKDASIDLMSLDPVFVPEFSEAQFLAPIPRAATAALTAGVVKPAIVGATWKGRLVAAPMWANTQLLWYRKSIARRAGLDPATQPVSWDQIIHAAQQSGTTVAVEGKRYEGYTVLINALVASAGGHIIKNSGAGADQLELGIESPAGERAAAIIREIARSGVAGPSLSTADEETARALFQGTRGAFMVNWPYVWQAEKAAVADGSLRANVVADIGWAQYPEAIEGTESKPPLGGIDLGIAHWSHHADLALDAIRCITSVQNETAYFLHDGNPAARSEVFDVPAVRKAFPMAPLIRASLQASAPRPQTEFYGDVSAGLQRAFHPPGSVTVNTPAAAGHFIIDVLRGNRLL